MGKLKSIIGLEVDVSGIRAVEISRSNGVFSIVACGKIPLGEGVMEEGFIRDADAFNTAFTELMQNGGFKSLNVIVGVNNENVIMRYATFPKVSSDKLRNMVLLQAQEFIPIPVQEMEIDYVEAGEGVNDEDQAVVNVLLVAVRRNMIEQFINYLAASKYQVVDIDCSTLSLCRGLSAIVSEEEKYAIVDLTDDLLNFLVIQGQEISMVRSITIPERAADAVTRMFRDSAEGTASEEDVEAVGSMLASEISSSVSYYSMQHMDSPIQKLYFTATTPQNKKIAEEISSVVSDIPVIVPNFYEKQNFGYEQDVINEFAGCIGLAIQALEVK